MSFLNSLNDEDLRYIKNIKMVEHISSPEQKCDVTREASTSAMECDSDGYSSPDVEFRVTGSVPKTGFGASAGLMTVKGLPECKNTPESDDEDLTSDMYLAALRSHLISNLETKEPVDDQKPILAPHSNCVSSNPVVRPNIKLERVEQPNLCTFEHCTTTSRCVCDEGQAGNGLVDDDTMAFAVISTTNDSPDQLVRPRKMADCSVLPRIVIPLVNEKGKLDLPSPLTSSMRLGPLEYADNLILEEIYPRKSTEDQLLKNELISMECKMAELRRNVSSQLRQDQTLLRTIGLKQRMVVDLERLTRGLQLKILSLQTQYHQKFQVLKAQVKEVDSLKMQREALKTIEAQRRQQIGEMDVRIQGLRQQCHKSDWKNTLPSDRLDKSTMGFLRSCSPANKIAQYVNMRIEGKKLPFLEPREYFALDVSEQLHSLLVKCISCRVEPCTLPVLARLLLTSGSAGKPSEKHRVEAVNHFTTDAKVSLSGPGANTDQYYCVSRELDPCSVRLEFTPPDKASFLPVHTERYYLADLKFIETQLRENVFDSVLWIEASIRHARCVTDRLESMSLCLHVLSRGLEFLPEDRDLWVQYLRTLRNFKYPKALEICSKALKWTKYDVDVAWKVADICPSLLDSKIKFLFRCNSDTEDGHCLTILLVSSILASPVDSSKALLEEIPNVMLDDGMMVLLAVHCHLHLLMFNALPPFLLHNVSDRILEDIRAAKADGFVPVEFDFDMAESPFSERDITDCVEMHMLMLADVIRLQESTRLCCEKQSHMHRANPITGYLYTCIRLLTSLGILKRFESSLGLIIEQLPSCDRIILLLESKKKRYHTAEYLNGLFNPEMGSAFGLWASTMSHILADKNDKSTEQNMQGTRESVQFPLPNGFIDLGNFTMDRVLELFQSQDSIDCDSSLSLITICMLSAKSRVDRFTQAELERLAGSIDADTLPFYVLSLLLTGLITLENELALNRALSWFRSTIWEECSHCPRVREQLLSTNPEMFYCMAYQQSTFSRSDLYLRLKGDFGKSTLLPRSPVQWLMFYKLSLELGLINEAKEIINGARSWFPYMQCIQDPFISV